MQQRQTMVRQTIFFVGALFFVVSLLYKIRGAASATSDFTAFWAAGRALNSGLDPYQPHQSLGILIPGGTSPFPFLSPIFLAELMAPLGAMPFHMAKILWLLLSIGMAAVVLVLLLRWSGIPPRWKPIVLGASAMLSFNPTPFSLANGQTDWVVLLAIVISWHLLRERRDFWAGVVLCCGAVNPQLVVGFGLYYVLHAVVRRDWRVVAGMTVGLAALFCATLPYWKYDLEWVTAVLPKAQLNALLEQPGQLTAIRVLTTFLPGTAPVLAAALDAFVVALGLVTWWLVERETAGSLPALGIATAVTLLISTFAFNQDYLLLVLLIPVAVDLWQRSAGSPPWCLLLGGAAVMMSGVTGFVIPARHLLFEVVAPLVLIVMVLSQMSVMQRRIAVLSIVVYLIVALGGFVGFVVVLRSNVLQALLVVLAMLSVEVALAWEIIIRRAAGPVAAQR